MRISLSEGFLPGPLAMDRLLSAGRSPASFTSLSFPLSPVSIYTSLSRRFGGASFDLPPLLSFFEDAGGKRAGSSVILKSRSLPSETRRTSLSLETIGGGALSDEGRGAGVFLRTELLLGAP